jgi:uracil-DNA glycosylase
MIDWNSFIAEQKAEPYFKALTEFVLEDAKTHTVYPKSKDVFNAFKLCSLDKVRAVILGQDPYIREDQAMGLAFSVPQGVEFPPSLRNIFKELKSDLGIDQPAYGDLTAWAKQGVFLLNSVLTVRAGESGSHANKGWETFTNQAIQILNDQDRPLVFLLWGGYAKRSAGLIYNDRHLVLTAAHPSPLSAHSGFFGCKHFSKTNEWLVEHDIEPVDWRLD